MTTKKKQRTDWANSAERATLIDDINEGLVGMDDTPEDIYEMRNGIYKGWKLESFKGYLKTCLNQVYLAWERLAFDAKAVEKDQALFMKNKYTTNGKLRFDGHDAKALIEDLKDPFMGRLP